MADDAKRQRIYRKARAMRDAEAFERWRAEFDAQLAMNPSLVPRDTLGPFAVDHYGAEVARLVEWGRCSLGLAPWLVHRRHPLAKTSWKELRRSTTSGSAPSAARSSRRTSTLRRRISRLIRRLREALRA